MTDPISIPAGVAGLLSLSIQVSQSLFKFYTTYKDQDSNLDQTARKLADLVAAFRNVEDALKGRRFRRDEEPLVQNITRSIEGCEEIITEHEKERKKYDPAFGRGVRDTARIAGRRIAYPFRQSTLQKLDEDISEMRSTLTVALHALGLADQKIIRNDLAGLRSLIEHVQTHQVSSAIRDWLKAPDATVNHNSMRAKHHEGTGLWFVRGHLFKTWLARDCSFLWINGFAGCGKSVLCSTAIEYTFQQHHNERCVGILFFYFTFNDESKRDESAMIRAFLLQLAGQLGECQTDLANLHGSYQSSTPPTNVMMEHLWHMIRRFQHVYILLDALDESPLDGRREGVLGTLQKIRQWNIPGLHLLVTSRNEPDIHGYLSPLTNEVINLRNHEIDCDIRSYISSQLDNNPCLRKWKQHHSHVQQALSDRAQGV